MIIGEATIGSLVQKSTASGPTCTQGINLLLKKLIELTFTTYFLKALIGVLLITGYTQYIYFSDDEPS